MNNIRYALVFDSGFQWLSYVIKYELLQTAYDRYWTLEYHSISKRISNTEFACNIFARPIEFYHLGINVNGLYGVDGWHISEKDFNRLAEMANIEKYLDQFDRLAKI